MKVFYELKFFLKIKRLSNMSKRLVKVTRDYLRTQVPCLLSETYIVYKIVMYIFLNGEPIFSRS